MPTKQEETGSIYSAFAGYRLIGHGNLEEVLRQCKALEAGAQGTQGAAGAPEAAPLIFEEGSGRQVDFDLRGTLEEVLARAIPSLTKAGPGRPKLGVVSREVTLLPRQWEWLEQDPHGISAALRRLVDEAKKRDNGRVEREQKRDAISRFMWSIAGNLPDFEEATRALFASDREGFERCIAAWPTDLRQYLVQLTQTWFGAQS